MANKSVFCIAASEAQASEIVTQLKSAGFRNDDICALLPDKTGTKDLAHEQHTKAPEGAVTGGLLGGIVCGGIGWLAGIGTLAIPGLGPFIAAGPILAALSGLGVGTALGGLVGALIGLARPEYEVRRYHGKLHEGNILLSVHCEKEEALREAKQILDRAGAGHIATSLERSVKNTSGDESAVGVSGLNQPV